jgi:hypothetical protein
MKITSAKDLVDKVLKDVETLTAEEAKLRIEKENAILIDIRDIRELWREGTVENSKHIPRGMLEFWMDPESPYSKNEIALDKNLILVNRKDFFIFLFNFRIYLLIILKW